MSSETGFRRSLCDCGECEECSRADFGLTAGRPITAEPGPFLPCYYCGRQPGVDRDGAYVYVYCRECADCDTPCGATYTGRVADAGEHWDDIMDQEEPRWT